MSEKKTNKKEILIDELINEVLAKYKQDINKFNKIRSKIFEENPKKKDEQGYTIPHLGGIVYTYNQLKLINSEL